jgi:hypothetical protein
MPATTVSVRVPFGWGVLASLRPCALVKAEDFQEGLILNRVEPDQAGRFADLKVFGNLSIRVCVQPKRVDCRAYQRRAL